MKTPRRLIALLLMGSAQLTIAQSRVIEILADRHSRYHVAGEKDPVITLKAGEQITVRISAERAKTWNRDGSIHGFAMLRKDGSKVPGWNLLLKPGTQDFILTAPSEPGEYTVLCTVICSDAHEQMRMKVFVTS